MQPADSTSDIDLAGVKKVYMTPLTSVFGIDNDRVDVDGDSFALVNYLKDYSYLSLIYPVSISASFSFLLHARLLSFKALVKGFSIWHFSTTTQHVDYINSSRLRCCSRRSSSVFI